MTTLAADHAGLMDRTYRYTRHVYDLSRRYYLLGRDRLLRAMPIQPGDAVIEIGCGTARNLIKLARMHPQARLYGLDASQRMLDTAATNLRRAGLADRVTLRHGLAEDLDFRAFGLDRPFDAAIFSYCLSMVPPWREAIDAALGQLGPGGTMGIVDFYDQRDLPAWFGRMLTRWLAMFHVRYRPELAAYLESAAARHHAVLQLTSFARRYAFIATITKP
jgi:S-adenosylmethionine-diacylgycerolhomoserine-N-methlytransferase